MHSWEVGYYTDKGVWVKITHVYTVTEDDEAAKILAHQALSRPGRYGILQTWKDRGSEVLLDKEG